MKLCGIIAHMVEERFRLCRYADLVRESIDGTTGD